MTWIALLLLFLGCSSDTPEPRTIQLPALSTEGVKCFCVGNTVGAVLNDGTHELCEKQCTGSGYLNDYPVQR